MKKGWSIRNFADVVFLQEGPGIRKYEYEDGGFPMINVRCVQDGYVDMSKSRSANMELATSKWKHFQIDEGDILFTISGTIGRSAIVRKTDLPLLMNTSVVRFKSIDDNLDSKFLYHYVRSNVFIAKLKSMSTGMAIQNVGPSHLVKMSVPIPPISEQKEISAILDKAFENIDKALENEDKNIKNAEELFQSKLKDIFSEKGDGWEEKTLGEISIVKSGGTPSRSQKKYWNGSIPWYSSRELNTTYTKDPERYINQEALDNSSAKLFTKGSLLIGMYDTAALKMSILDRDGAFNQAISGVMPNDTVDLNFILHSINSIKPDVLKQRSGVRQKNLNLSKIKNIPISLPPISEQKEIVVKLDALENELNSLKAKREKRKSSFEELKKSILQKAINGELTNNDKAA